MPSSPNRKARLVLEKADDFTRTNELAVCDQPGR